VSVHPFIFLAVAGLLLPPARAEAQRIGFGITGGAIRSEVNSRGDESQNVALEHRSQPTGGLFLTVPVSESFWIQPEVLVSVKGTRWNTADLEGALRLTYLELPALVRFAGPRAARVRIHVFGGPSLGLLLNASSVVSRPASARIDVEERYRDVDLGWVLGVGIGDRRWHLDLRYGGSITRITDEPQLAGGAPPPAVGASATFRNRAFQLLAGVRLF